MVQTRVTTYLTKEQLSAEENSGESSHTSHDSVKSRPKSRPTKQTKKSSSKTSKKPVTGNQTKTCKKVKDKSKINKKCGGKHRSSDHVSELDGSSAEPLRPASNSTPANPSVTPMPNNSHLESFVGVTDLGPEDEINDRSLTDMLADTVTPPTQTHCSSSRLSEQDTIVVLETEIELKNDENNRLKSQVELLESEIDRFHKLQKNQTTEIKRLTADNDKLRRELSRHQGMRRFVTESDTNVEGDTSKQAEVQKIKDELTITHTKLQSLKEHMREVATSMITALDDEYDQEYQMVSNRRNNRKYSENNGRQAVPTPTMTSQPSEQQAIQVIQGGAPVTSNPRPTGHQSPQPRERLSYSDVLVRQNTQGNGKTRSSNGNQQSGNGNNSRPQRRNTPGTVVIGTSLTRGLGSELIKHGVDATCVTYPGSHIMHIRSRVGHILDKTRQPNQVVLQCGGNDLEELPPHKVISQYDSLISDVRKQCTNATIVLSTVPYRSDNVDTWLKIDKLNTYLENRGKRGDGVTCVDVVPNSLHYFKRDLVHFNQSGIRFYGQRLAGCLKNFHWSHQRDST